MSAETISTAAISPIGIDVLPPGVAVTPASATQMTSRLWLPSRPTTTIPSLSPGSMSSWPEVSGHIPKVQFISMRVPQPWLLTVTVEFSGVAATRAIVSADASARAAGTGATALDCTASSAPSTTTAAATIDVNKRDRRRRRPTLVSSCRLSGGGALDPSSSIAATSSRVNFAGSVDVALSSVTDSRHDRQALRCAAALLNDHGAGNEE